MSTTTLFTKEDFNTMMEAEGRKFNEKGEVVLTKAAFERFKKENEDTFQVINSKNDETRFAIVNVGVEKVTKKDIIGVVRLTVQVHNKTGETAKVVSGKAPDGVRYKVIYVKSKDRYEIWSAFEGKRKCVMRDADKDKVIAEYRKLIKGKTEKEVKSA